MENDKKMLSVCGLTCDSCPLYNLPYDKKAAEDVYQWFLSEGWYTKEQRVSDILENGDYCKGCRSDRTDIHWSPDCYLLKCCIDEKHLNNCSECGDFPCDEYEQWVKQGSHHRKAYENLILIKKGKKPIKVDF